MEQKATSRFGWIPRLVLVLALLYFFLVAIQLLGGSFKAVGEDSAKALIASFENPFAGLFAGVLATVMVQSSSVTTATVVGLVGTGSIPFSVAVPMIMGANIGTTITNTLVSMGHVTRKEEFRRAFAGATVHDFFNLLTVSILFPLELMTGFLQKSAHFLAQLLPQTGGKYPNPIKTAVKWSSKHIQTFFEDVLGLQGGWLAGVLFLVAIALIMLTLYFITKNMKALMAGRIERMLNDVLGRSGLLGIFVGMLITVAVQSSSITTSLLIPLFGAGLLRLRVGFPIMIGANIGTTVTALLAAMVTNIHGLEIALVHLMFNLCGTLMFFPFEYTRNIPVRCAEWLADLAVYNRAWVLAYVGIVFVVIPGLGILFFKLLAK